MLESSKCEPKFYGVTRAPADTNSPFTTNWEVSEYAGSNLVYEKTPDLAKRISWINIWWWCTHIFEVVVVCPVCNFSHITILTESSGAKAAANAAAAAVAAGAAGAEAEEEGGGVDLRTLRAIRVLRPLKLVSGVPSKYSGYGSFFPAKVE